MPLLCWLMLTLNLIITNVSVLRWFLMFLIWHQHYIRWYSISKHCPLLFLDHSFITSHQFDDQFRIDIVIKSYAHVLHCVSITIVNKLMFYHSFIIKMLKETVFWTENKTHQKWKPVDDNWCQLTDRLALIIDENW